MAGDVGGSASATKFSGTPAQNTATGTPPAGVQSAMQGLGAMGDGAGMNSGMGAGGKGGGGMQPQKTAMGTPIVYGKSYLPNPVSGQPNAGVPVTPTTPDYSMDGDGSGGYADGTMSVPAYAYGSMSVPAYAYGSTSVEGYEMGTMGVDEDPWAWTKAQSMSAPLAAEIKPSTDQPPPRMPDATEQQLGSLAMSKGIDATTKGIDTAYKAYGASAPLAAMPVAEAAAADLALGGLGGTAGASALTAGTGATGAAALGGEAALAAMGPVGMVIGGALLAKKLGIF